MVIIPYMEQVGYVIWSKHGLFDGHESIKRDSNITSGRNPYKQMDLLSTYPIKSCRLYAGTNTGFLLGEFWVRCMPLACPDGSPCLRRYVQAGSFSHRLTGRSMWRPLGCCCFRWWRTPCSLYPVRLFTPAKSAGYNKTW